MTHETYIKRCLQIAKNGLGVTRPNPSVGAVLVVDDVIIGEGFTSKYGGNHAEVNAIESVKDKSLLQKATIYVTLEPCSHYGKTPPCSDLIIRSGIKKVVIGCVDSNALVSGKGVEKLKNAGCEVVVGVLENECKTHHKRFLTFHNKKRPFIILKWAETKDGFIAPLQKNEQKPVWITNTKSRQYVHQLRAKEQAILVGTNTVLEDNPSLTVRDINGENPTRIVLDKTLKLPKNVSVFNDKANTIVFTEKQQIDTENITFCQINFSESIAQQICKKLYDLNIQSVIIEGGTKTLQTFIDEGLWDEAFVFVGDVLFGEGVKAPVFTHQAKSEQSIINDQLKVYRND